MSAHSLTTPRADRPRRSKKRPIAILTAILVLVGGGAAYAYWTVGGSGTGSATTAATAQSVTVVQTSTVSGIAPGTTAQTLSGTFTNPNNASVYVTSVTAAISGVVKASGAVAGTCDATDYTLTNATMTVGQQVGAGSGQGTWSGATLAFTNKATNQDQCKGATVTLSYTAN
jgi:hypothetical protein